MNENCHISRNVRLSWFLSRLNQVIRPSPKNELLAVLSILPKGWQPDSPPSSSQYLLVPSTRVIFLARRYRFVIELDLSPSTGIVDDSTGEVIFDEVFHALSRCLLGLAAQFKVPGTDFLFQPEIFITILAYSSIVGLSSHQVLVQGCQLDCAELDQFLHQIYQQLRVVENNIAESNGSIPADTTEDLTQWKQKVSMVTVEVGLVSMVRQGILALQLLPSNSSAGIIIITDGVMSVPDVAVCETLLNQLRSGTVACSFVQVGGAYSYDCSFGYVPNVELMKFISVATFGTYLSLCPDPVQVDQEMNSYHRSFLTYSFIRTYESINPDYYCFSQHKLFNEHLVSASGNPALGLRRKKHTEKEVHADLISVLSVRLREGYTIRDISFTKGGTQLEVKLVLLWKHNMRIEYVAVTSWPLLAEQSTWMEVTMEGSYDILHDLSCTLRKPITSPYRTAVIRRFWNTLHGINQTDQMLVHLQSFSSIPEHYTIPESTKNGLPLFYIPPGSTTPVLSLQHNGSKDSSHSQFTSYWKPVLSMDANVWQRWLHMHRIAIILEHDVPVPKHVHSAGNNGRFSTIQCRIAHSALTSLLRDWSSFVLVEGYSYVKFIYSPVAHVPISFYLVRLISKAPCMVLRLGFPIGTPANTRNKIVDELREQILRLRFPHRVQNKEATPKTKRKNLGNASPSKSPPLPALKPALSDRPCVVIFNKPLEKLLIRYEKLPTDFRTPFMLNLEALCQPLSMATGRTFSSTMAFLSRYFLQQRWVWTMHSGPGGVVSLNAVAHILSTLAEIRLSEGFHFATSGEGIVNMVMELPMAPKTPKETSALQDTQQHTCIIQYVLFPPYSTSTKDSFSTDDDNDTEVEAIDVETELNLVTECWVEPQSGSVLSQLEQQRHFHNLRYQDIPQAIFPRDQSCMSTLLTFEYLIQLCKNKDQPQPLSSIKDATAETPGATPADSIHIVPFQFDLMKLLPRCQQIELFFYTFSKAENEDSLQNVPSLPNDLLLSLFHSSLQTELSDREIILADGDNMTFMNHILERERDGHVAPFSIPVIKEAGVKPIERQDTTLPFQTIGSSKEVTGSTSTLLQSFSNTDMVDEEPVVIGRERLFPQWKCYAKHISAQQVLLIFLPATYTDVQILMSFGLGLEPQVNGACNDDEEETLSLDNNQSLSGSHSSSVNGPLVETECVMEASDERCQLPAEALSREPEDSESHRSEPTPQVSSVEEKDCVQFSVPQTQDYHRQLSQHSGGDGARPRCPVYIYNCCMDLLKDQLLQQHSNRQPKDVFLSLQLAYSISSQDVLTAMDYCEESLQEIDITAFLQTLCGHVRTFREQHEPHKVESTRKTLRKGATFTIGEEEDKKTSRAMLLSSSSIELEDIVEVESKGKASTPTSPDAPGEPCFFRVPEFPLSLLQLQQTCEVYPDLHKIIQDKFLEIGAQHFKTVPSNPHYFFYCPQSSKKDDDSDEERDRRPSEDCDVSEAELATEDENMSGCCIVSDSDTDLEVEYQDQENEKAEDEEEEGARDDSGSESNTVNQDEDSFSILDGDSVLEAPEPEMPPLFVHLVCSVNTKSCHGSMPIRTLPTCLGELISCLDNAESLQSIDLNELSVTLDVFVLTLPLEIEVMSTGINHIRYTSESSVSMNRSPGQPSSYRSDEELMENLDSLRGVGMDGMTGDPLSKLPVPHKQAVLATMDEIRWLLEDEIVSALRHSSVVDCSTLQKVADHVFRSSGRPGCHHELVPLQFVFGPEQSLEKFKEEFRRFSFPGYLLNAEKQNFYYISQSRLHSHRLQTAGGLNQTSVFSQEEESVIHPASHIPEVDSSLKTAASDLPFSKELENEAVPQKKEVNSEQVKGGEAAQMQHQTEQQKEPEETTEEDEEVIPGASDSASNSLTEQIRVARTDNSHSQSTNQQTVSSAEYIHPRNSGNGLESEQCIPHGSEKIRPSRVQSVVSSQGSVDSDMLGYDGGSSDSECDGPNMDEHEFQSPLMPDFWLIIQIQTDRLEVFSHSRSFNTGKEKTPEDEKEEEEEEEIPEYLRLHQLIVEEIGKICRKVNQRLLLQDLHDTHVCNSLLVAESEEDIWKNEPLYRQRIPTSDDYNADESYQQRDYLAATMHFMPGHFACDVVWNTIIQIHPRLKMGPNMGVARAIQALRSVLSAFCVVNRKNMFVYQERTTKSVFYLRLSETSQTGPYTDLDVNLHVSRSLALARSQEPLGSEDLTGSRSSLEGSRPVGQVDKHILLLVHGVERAGPEITDELVKVLRKRLDEATLDIITVMLVRNCKLTPADVEFIQPPGSAPTEVMEFSLPQYSIPWIRALAHYLGQNLLIFLHIPKYTDMEHHFKHYFHVSTDLPYSDIYLYNKPGGQGTGGKGTMSKLVQHLFSPSQFQGIACIALSFVDAQDRPLYVSAHDSGRTRGDAASISLQPEQFDSLTTVLKLHSNEPSTGGPVRVRFDIWEQGNVSPLQLTEKLRSALRHALCDLIMEMKVLPNPLCLETFCITEAGQKDSNNTFNPQSERKDVKESPRRASAVKSGPVPITLNSAPSSTPTTGANTPESTTPTGKNMRRSFWEILEKAEDSRASRRRHKTESVKQQWSHEKAVAVEREQAQSSSQGALYVPLSHVQPVSYPPSTTRNFIIVGRNFQQWHYSMEQEESTDEENPAVINRFTPHKGLQRFEALEHSDWLTPGQDWKGVAPRQRFLHMCIVDKKLSLYIYNWSVDVGASLSRDLVRLVQWQNARAHTINCLLSQKMGLFHHYCFADTPAHEDIKQQEPNPFLSSTIEADALLRSPVPPVPNKDGGRLGNSGRGLPHLPFPAELVPFDEALRDVSASRLPNQEGADIVARHGAQLLEVKAAERRELEKQMKIENLFVTWQQRSAQSNMPISKRHRSNDSAASGRDRSHSTDSAELLPVRFKEEQEICSAFMQQYVQYLQSLGFILGFYFCVKQYALECSRIPMGQTVNSQLSMLFTEECDKVRDLMHVHSFSYDFHLRVVHQYLLGCHMTLRQGYQLNSFLEEFISHYPDIPKFGRNHVFQGNFSMSTGMITAHQLYNYITDHAGTYGMKPLRMSKTSANTENKKGGPSADLHEYALVALWNSSGTYKDLEGLRHHDDFDVSLLVCHDAAPFEEQSDGERHLLRLRYYVIMTSQRELFPRLTADMRRFRKLPQIYRDPSDPSGRGNIERTDAGVMGERESEHDLWEETASVATSQHELAPQPGEHPSGAESEEDSSDFPDLSSPLFPLLNSEVMSARKQIQGSVTEAMAHCRRDNLWRRLFHGEHAAHDKLKLSKLAFAELEELLDAVQSRSIGDIDPQLECFLTMNPAWYQSLIKVLLLRFPQSCRHFVDDCGIQYLAVLNQKFTDCFVLVFLDSQAGKTSLKVVFREPLPSQAQPSSSPPPQLVSMYHHLESVINTACYNLWTGLL
ncbi:KICSTOR complex protein SZT2 [Bagarius yarrelli]|uniref:KICSTOR complex protein SZT2 n=1 Tax=Bagarius yarrelli TaxID=175774 RepID=A0A556VYB3_BAGYA|nr:KICSTOR complex protein SZT2 [Bagarius yarrelli]